MKRLSQFDTFAIKVSTVYVDMDFNCRGYFTLESVSDLARSIDKLGLQMPIVVQPYTEKPGYDYRLIAGYRRFAACTRFLNWTEIPAQVRRDLTEEQARLLNFTENLERNDLNILEEAKALANCFPLDMGCREIHKIINRPTRWINARRALLRLPEEVQQLAAAGWLKPTNIEVLARLDSPEEQIEGARRLANAREKGGNKAISKLPRKYTGNFRQRKKKETIKKMIAHLVGQGVYGGMPRALAWAAGYIDNADLEQDIQERLREQERLEEGTDG